MMGGLALTPRSVRTSCGRRVVWCRLLSIEGTEVLLTGTVPGMIFAREKFGNFPWLGINPRSGPVLRVFFFFYY